MEMECSLYRWTEAADLDLRDFDLHLAVDRLAEASSKHVEGLQSENPSHGVGNDQMRRTQP